MVTIDKNHFDCCYLDSESHIRESLGEPLVLPQSIQESEQEEDFLRLFSLMKGCDYELVVRNNTYNEETDLDQFFVYSVYAPVGSSDWVWQRDTFVRVEMGQPGDPRYVNYNHPEVYDLGDTMLGDSGFFNWTLSWFAQYLIAGEVSTESDNHIEDINSRISDGYSCNPTHELRQLCYADPIWVEKFDGYVARPKYRSFPMVFRPEAPIYG